MECQYCKKILKNKYTLKSHQSTTKACLSLRGLECSFVCSACNEEFTLKGNLQRHQTTCVELKCQQLLKEQKTILTDQFNRKMEKTINKLMEKHLDKISSLRDENNSLQDKNNSLRDQIYSLKERLAHYEGIEEGRREMKEEVTDKLLEITNTSNERLIQAKDECIEIAKNSRPITQNNIYNYFKDSRPIDLEGGGFQQEIEEFVDRHDVVEMSTKAVAQSLVREVFTDGDCGKFRLLCTDPSRLMYSFKSPDGNIIRDKKLEKVKNVMQKILLLPIHSALELNVHQIEEYDNLYDICDQDDEHEQRFKRNRQENNPHEVEHHNLLNKFKDFFLFDNHLAPLLLS